jgi:hypothetical protein
MGLITLTEIAELKPICDGLMHAFNIRAHNRTAREHL